MAYHLIVTTPFADKNVGERIQDQDEVTRILESHHSKHVVKITAPDMKPSKADK